MKNAITVLCVLFVLFVGCNDTPIRRATVTDYHATSRSTEVEWDIEFGETAQMSLSCETVYITAIKEKDGKIKLLLKSERSK
jgi:major membrane immunogen (membrane-anchored lipoprotein)